MNTKLQDTVAIFKELGWENVTFENVLSLPLGTTEQKKTALDGLKSGDWGEFAKTGSNSYGWRSYIDVDSGNLALFAVRIGVNAQRAVNILRNSDNEMMLEVIAARGEKYASDFIGYACVSRRRMYEHSASVFGNVAVKLVDKLGMDIPQNVEYMKDWSVYAAAALGLKAEVRYKETGLPELGLIEKRFIEHIHTGVAVNVPGTGPFGAVLPTGVKRGWLSREKGIELSFSALDAAVRPGDRKIWLDVMDKLGISDKELLEHAQALIPLLSSGDAAMIVRLAPVLIAQSDDTLLVEVLPAAFSSPTKKAKQIVLRAALERSCPKGVEELTPWLSILSGDTDKTICSLAAKLMKQWKIETETMPEEKAEIQGFWQETPPVWAVPSFSLEEVSPEALTELAAVIVNRPALVHDVVTERFLAVANAIAYQDPEAARISLRGLRPRRQQLLDFIIYWINKETPVYGADNDKNTYSPLHARDYIVCFNLDKLPCLLSTPSVDDLTINVSDLIARLEIYKKSEINVLEADLFLALTRLDVTTKTPESIDSLRKLNIPVLLQSGDKMTNTAGQVVLTYLETPLIEPPFVLGSYWSDISSANSLRGFPSRFSRYMDEYFSVFPCWGDTSLRDVRWDSEVYHEQGLVMRQVARRAAPLPPGASINFMAALRSMTPDAAEDSMRAVTEAWERGLLRPGIADVGMMDWSSQPPYNLVALASALDGIARDGMLSVVWPVPDALIEASLKEPRLLAGTAELAELILLFLPEVEVAMKQGIADKNALYLPGIRSLALRDGSSRAVSVAKKIVDMLPSALAVPKQDKKDSPVMDTPFDEIWPAQKKAPATLSIGTIATGPIDDGATISIDWVNPSAPTKIFLFTLTVPDITDRVFQIVKNGWFYELESEGQCQAYAVTPSITTLNESNQIWLHWDAKKKSIVACDHRNWLKRTDGPLDRAKVPPLTSSLLTVIVGLLAQDGDATYYAPKLLRESIENGAIDEEMIRKAVQTLLQNPVVSPAKLVRILEKNIKLLHVLWPMLTESIKFAGALTSEGNTPPVWINRVLDIAIRFAPYLVEAAKRGLIPAEDARWTGLTEIASSKAKSTAVAKAKKLLTVLN